MAAYTPLQVHRISHARPIPLHQHPAWLCSHIFCHTNSNINAFHSHWTIIFTRQVVKTNRPIKFNDQIIMKSGYSNPTRSKKEKYQLTTMFCGQNLTKWWVIFFPFLTSQNTKQCQKQSGNQFLLLNPSFKGRKSWKSWSIVTILLSPCPLKKREFISLWFGSTTLKLSIFLKC